METSKAEILDLVCALYGDKDPASWKSQYADVRQERKQLESQANAQEEDATCDNTREDESLPQTPWTSAKRSSGDLTYFPVCQHFRTVKTPLTFNHGT